MSTGEDYDLSPSKRTLRSLKSDVTPIAAVKELVDNVIDNWRRLGDEESSVTIDIDMNFEEETFRIEDNSGGLSEDNVKKIFALGGSTKEEIDFPIGSYGMGAKKAIVRLGSNAEIKSRSIGSDTGYGFKITEDWLESPGWSVEKLVFDEVREGSTVIKIEDLNIEFEEEGEGEDGEESGFSSPDGFIERLRKELAETYDEFLTGRAGPEGGEFTIKVNGQSIDSSEGVEWSFTPYDDFSPRHFKGYEISPDDLPNRTEPVKVDIIAGVMPRGSMEKSGTDVIIQNRRILTSNKGPMGGWGTHLKNHADNLARVRFIVKIYAENHPEDLPWDTQKGRIELNNSIADEAFNFLRRAGRNYAMARYEQFPTPFSAPYSHEQDFLTKTAPEELDYSNKYRVVDNPDSNFPQTDQVTRLSKKHSDLQIFGPHLISDAYQPSYEQFLEDSLDLDPEEDLWRIPESVAEFPERRLHLWLEVVNEIAGRHSEGGRRIDFDEQPWWGPYYDRCLEHGERPVGELESTASPNEVENTVQSRITSDDIPNLILTDEDIRTFEKWSIDENGEEVSSEGSSEEQEESEDEEEEGEDDSDVNQQKLVDESDDVSRSNDESSDNEEDEDEENNGTPDFGTTGREVQLSSSETKRIVIEVVSTAYSDICDDLGLDESDNTARQVGNAIVEQGVDVREYVNPELEGEND